MTNEDWLIDTGQFLLNSRNHMNISQSPKLELLQVLIIAIFHIYETVLSVLCN